MDKEKSPQSRDRKESEANKAAQVQDTIFKRPQIIRQPMNQMIKVGERLRLTVHASGVPVPRFRWRFNGSTLEGVSSNVLVIPNLRLAHSGVYTAEAYNVVGSDTSRGASIQVLRAETESEPATVQIVPNHIEVSPGKEFVFVAELNNCEDTEPRYQWFKDGKRIKSANTSSLRIMHAKEKYVGTYVVVVETRGGLIQSEAASLVLSPEPAALESVNDMLPLPADPLELPPITLEDSTRTRDTAGFLNFPLDRERQRLERQRDRLVCLLGAVSRVLKAG